MELYRALAALCERPTAELQGVADSLEAGPLPPASEHTEIFSLQLRPYASVYLSDDGRLGGEARDRIAGFWRVLGLEPPPECDHLSVLLAFYAELRSREAEAPSEDLRERSTHLRTAFLEEHLLSWLPAYLLKLESFGSAFYSHWAGLCARVLCEDANPAATGPLSLHLRSTTPHPSAEACDRDALVTLLTSPARSGLLLTRGDLTLAARQHGLAGRMGERAFMLEAMLAQGPTEVLSWFSQHISHQRDRYRSRGREIWGDHLNEWTLRLSGTQALVDAINPTSG
jgi:TorA maturation chaperone TorD